MEITSTTSGGTPVYEPTESEFVAFLECESAQFGMSVDEFRRALAGGELDASAPDVSYFAALLNACYV